jgi:ComF family protein
VLSRVVDLVLPPRCGACRAVGSWLCNQCRAEVKYLEEPTCRRCGVELEFARKSCGCRTRLKALSRLRSAVAYEGPIELAVQRFKYEGWRRLAGPLAVLLAERLMVEGLAGSWALAVPLHPDRLRQRGFNQAELLARELRARLALSRPPGALVRIRPTPPQVGHDRLWRKENVRGAFAWKGANLGGQPVLVVDDVATTGATLESCAVALRESGSGPVTGVSVARVIL